MTTDLKEPSMQLLCSRSTTSMAYQSSFLLNGLAIGRPACFVDVDSSVLVTHQTSSLKALHWFVNGPSEPQLSLGAIGGWLLAIGIFQPHPDPQSEMSCLSQRQ
ncbi:hypothetical protein V6Z77_005961 [Aspergillus fumigatus]